jgi:hypothetical protein
MRRWSAHPLLAKPMGELSLFNVVTITIIIIIIIVIVVIISIVYVML